MGTPNLAIFKRGINVQKFEWVFRPPLGMGAEPHAARGRRGELGGIGAGPGQFALAKRYFVAIIFRKIVDMVVGDAICTIR
jgi:hypothetical protein